MNRTKIEWVKNPDGSQGYTWNPITGCLNGCSYCYARRLANGRLKGRYLVNRYVAPDNGFWIKEFEGIPYDSRYDAPFYPRFWEDRLDAPLFITKPAGIFVCDMGELFGDWIPTQWQRLIFWTINSCPQHRFYLLTKQPQNLPKFSPFPENCWVGVTATDSASFDKAVHHLAEVAAYIKYISFEPLLGPVFYDEKPFWGGVEWVIIGAQTKPYKPPRRRWVNDILRSAKDAGIPVFLKDNLRKGLSFPLLRQEMP